MCGVRKVGSYDITKNIQGACVLGETRIFRLKSFKVHLVNTVKLRVCYFVVLRPI